MSALISFRDEVSLVAEQWPNNDAITLTGGTVVSGNLKNLYTRQLESGAVIRPATSIGLLFELTANIRPSPAGQSSLAGVRAIAILGLMPPDGSQLVTRDTVIEVYGMPGQHLIGTVLATRIHGVDPVSGPVNRIIAAPSHLRNANGDGLTFTSYKIQFRENARVSLVDVKIGRIWIGNAVEIPNGVDADWTFGIAEAGHVAVSRGGQAYANRAQVLKTLSVNLSGEALDARQAFGIGVTTSPEGIRHASDWLSDAAITCGEQGNIIVVPRSDGDWPMRTAVYGRVTGPIRITHVAGDYYQSSIDVVEER